VRASRPRSEAMKRPLQQLIQDKRRWQTPLTASEQALGFKGWRSRGYLPHFDAPGVRQFITYRLADALPVERRHEWAAFFALQDEAEKLLKIEAYLDRGYGDCHLRNREIAAMVQDNLLHFDGERYGVLGWCIMPNHVHVMIEVWNTPLSELLHTWKSYTAKRANTLLGRAGDFWQDEYFDRYIRDEDHFQRVIKYVESNPMKAGLCLTPLDWEWSSSRHRDEYCRLAPHGRSAGGPPAASNGEPSRVQEAPLSNSAGLNL
jgi:putative transposase